MIKKISKLIVVMLTLLLTVPAVIYGASEAVGFGAATNHDGNGATLASLPVSIDHDTTFRTKNAQSPEYTFEADSNYRKVNKLGTNDAFAFKQRIGSSSAVNSQVRFSAARKAINADTFTTQTYLSGTQFNYPIMTIDIQNNTQDGFLIAIRPEASDVTVASGVLEEEAMIYDSGTNELITTQQAGYTVQAGEYAKISAPYVLHPTIHKDNKGNGVKPIPYQLIFETQNVSSGLGSLVTTDGSAGDNIVILPRTVDDDDARADTITLTNENEDVEDYDVVFWTPQKLTEPFKGEVVVVLRLNNLNAFNYAGQYKTDNKIAFVDL